MKKIPIVILLLAALTLTACGKTEAVSDGVPESAPGYIPPTAPDSVGSSADIPESSSESFSGMSETLETSDASSESDSEKITECPYKVGDLVGPEGLPSRGRAAYIVTITEIYPLDESRNKSNIEIYDERDELLYQNRYGDVYASYEYGADGQILREYESADEYTDVEYDDNGFDVKRTTSRGGRVTMISNISYDEHGELTEWISTYCDFENDTDIVLLHTFYENEYDENGRKIAYTAYNSDHEVRDSTVCEYDDRGVLRHQVRTEAHSGGGTSVREWYFDEMERQIMRTVTYTDSDGTMTTPYREELTYNEDGKLAECLHYNTKEDEFLELREVYTYQYE